jgi:hypothetical protein
MSEFASDSLAAPRSEEPSAPHAIKAAAEQRRLQYFAAFRYAFRSADWLQSLLLASVALLIPVFGKVALVGYYYEIVERLHRDPAAACATFDFKRFSTYCNRGVWTYLLLLSIVGVLQPVLQIPLQYTIMGVIFAFSSSAQTGAIVATVAAAVWLFLLVGIWLLMMFVYQPLALRGGLSQELPRMFRLAWLIDFGKKMWPEILLTNLWMFVASCILLPLGLLVMLFGVLPATVWLTVAGAHLSAQMYDLFLQRGGEPIRLHPAEAEPPPIVQPTGEQATDAARINDGAG